MSWRVGRESPNQIRPECAYAIQSQIGPSASAERHPPEVLRPLRRIRSESGSLVSNAGAGGAENNGPATGMDARFEAWDQLPGPAGLPNKACALRRRSMRQQSSRPKRKTPDLRAALARNP